MGSPFIEETHRVTSFALLLSAHWNLATSNKLFWKTFPQGFFIQSSQNQARVRMVSLKKPDVHFVSFEIVDILWKMKLYFIGNLSNGQFDLFSKFELFFVYKSLKLLLKVYL